MSKKRINITIDPELHSKVQFWSFQEGKSLSEKIEALLYEYNDLKQSKVALEPIISYPQNEGIESDIGNAISKLPVDKQMQVLEFAEFLIQRNQSFKKPSLLGLWKDNVFISPDFDSPLDEFKEYAK